MTVRLWPMSVPFVVAILLLPLPTAAAASKKTTATPMRFLVSTPKLTQELTVTPKGKKAIAFDLKLSGSCQRTVSGVAKLKGGDYESAEDENGVAYLANEFRHTAKNGCELIIWLKADDAKRATMLEVDCKAACAPVEDLMFRKDDTVANKSKPAK
jgi:hypothetical protein